MRAWILLALLVLACMADEPSRFRLNFGSCNKQGRHNPFWSLLEKRQADVFAWLGDIVYADTGIFWKWRIPATLEQLQESYRIFSSDPAYTHYRSTLPVIGVPISATKLDGYDALLSIVQMPKGVPVATVAIDGARNAGLLALSILSLSDTRVAGKLEAMKGELAAAAAAQDAELFSS